MKNDLTIFLILVLTIQFVYLKQNSKGHRCGLSALQKRNDHKPAFDLPIGEDYIRNLKSDHWEPIRIHLDYSFIERDLTKFNKKDLDALKNKIMPKTKEVFENILKVKRIKNKLKLHEKSCDGLTIPSDYLENGQGVNADIIIFVTIDDTGFFIQNEIEAAAIHCIQHSATNRPIAGYIQFKPDLELTDSTAHDYLTWLAVHEVSHILVMNDGLYQDYIDSNGEKLGKNKVISEISHPISGKNMHVIKSPKVLEKAKSHFGCNSLEGVPLEYNGGPGTAGAHWAKKFMNTDYMIGDSYGENLISEITLALFEDSGWYSVEYSLSNLFLWGKDKGCNFFNHKCVSESEQSFIELSSNRDKKNDDHNYHYKAKPISKINNKSNDIPKRIYTEFPEEFCNKPNRDVCSRHHIFRGNCNVKHYSNKLKEFEQYFKSNQFIGGVDNLVDKCPISIESKGEQYYYGGSCRKGEKRKSLEEICPECACFMSSLKLDGTTKTKKSSVAVEEDEDNINATCFKFSCDSSNKINVEIEGVNYPCHNKGIKISGYSGILLCPDSNILCHKKFKCKFGCSEKYSNSIPYEKFKKKRIPKRLNRKIN